MMRSYCQRSGILIWRKIRIGCIERLLMPVSCRRQLFDLSDDMATKIDIQFYSEARDALLEAMVE
jgi:predicted ATP-dependent Lon-type protease